MTLHDISRGRRSARSCGCLACRPSRDPRDHDGGTLAAVRLRGWQTAVVSSEHCGVEGCTDHEDRIRAGLPPSPRWAYTVGLGHTADHPELLIAGLDPALMGSVLDRIAEWVAHCGMRFAPGDVVEDLVPGSPVAVEAITDDAAPQLLRWSSWFHRRPARGLALVWPDDDGLFAWQHGASAQLDDAQPPAWRVPHEHGGGLAVQPRWPFACAPDHPVTLCPCVALGGPVRWVRRPPGDDAQPWTVDCGDVHDEAELVEARLLDVVRLAPSVRELADLTPGIGADRPEVGWEWRRLGPPAVIRDYDGE